MNLRQKSSDEKLTRFQELPSQGGGLAPALKHAAWSEILEESYRVSVGPQPAGIGSNSNFGDDAGAPDQP